MSHEGDDSCRKGAGFAAYGNFFPRFFATAGMDLWPSFAVLLACVASCIDAAIPAQGQATVFEPQQAMRCVYISGMQFLSSQRASDREDAFVHQ